jgi:putative SOS response-associated peptidase YedK
MCGRFVGFRRLEELKQYFPIERAACEVTASYNVAPSQQVLAIIKRDAQNWLDRFHWGLVPFWAKDQSVGNRMINARAETLAFKPSFRNAFKKRRCLILADGFY